MLNIYIYFMTLEIFLVIEDYKYCIFVFLSYIAGHFSGLFYDY